MGRFARAYGPGHPEATYIPHLPHTATWDRAARPLSAINSSRSSITDLGTRQNEEVRGNRGFARRGGAHGQA